MRISKLAPTALLVAIAILVPVFATSVPTVSAEPASGPSPPTVDGGAKTSGLAGEPVPQPSPPQRIEVGPDGSPRHTDNGPDTPGKTGLGNDQTDALGGADKGPGTQDVVPRNAQ